MNDIEIFATSAEDAFEQMEQIGLDAIFNRDCIIVHLPNKTFVYAFEDQSDSENSLTK